MKAYCFQLHRWFQIAELHHLKQDDSEKKFSHQPLQGQLIFFAVSCIDNTGRITELQ